MDDPFSHHETVATETPGWSFCAAITMAQKATMNYACCAANYFFRRNFLSKAVLQQNGLDLAQR
jgi:hypothetical protein